MNKIWDVTVLIKVEASSLKEAEVLARMACDNAGESVVFKSSRSGWRPEAPEGYRLQYRVSSYYGSHPEYGHSDIEYYFAVPNECLDVKDCHIDYSHGSHGIELDEQVNHWKSIKGCLIWSDSAGRWLNIVDYYK
jgi:hypothetical protein